MTLDPFGLPQAPTASGGPAATPGSVAPVPGGDLPDLQAFKPVEAQKPEQPLYVPILSEIINAGGAAIGTGVDALADFLGTVPSTSGLTDYNLGTDPMSSKVNWQDTARYERSAQGAVNLLNDLKAENGNDNMAAQFMVLGLWQKENDPQAFAEWESVLKRAQESTGVGTHAGEFISEYLRTWGVAYNDMTPNGLEGFLAEMPELEYGGSGSFGQGLTSDLSSLILLQRKAEKGASAFKEAPGVALAKALTGGDPNEVGGRLDEIRNMPEYERTDIESAVLQGLDSGWSENHALNFLLTHGQGYSHDPGVQLALSLALDPLTVGSLGASSGAIAGAKSLQYANTLQSQTRLGQTFEAVAKSVGTTAQAVRADPVLGPIARVTRGIIDPFTMFPGSHGAAKVDVFESAGLQGYANGMGVGSIKSAVNRAKEWGVKEIVEGYIGVSAMNSARKWAVNGIVENLLQGGRRTMETRRIIPEEVIQQAGRNAPKDAVSRVSDYVFRHRQYWLSSAGKDALVDRITKVVNQPRSVVEDAVKTMSPDEMAVWHHVSYSAADVAWQTAKEAVPPGGWGALEGKADDLALLNPMDLDRVAGLNLLDELRNLKGKARVNAWNAAADKYDVIESLGRVTTGGANMVERRMNALNSYIQKGGLHAALDLRELKNLPPQVRTVLDAWKDGAGSSMWRVGFKPSAEMATGLLADDFGNLVARFSPNIDNVTTAIRRPKRATPVADALGRIIPDSVAGSRVVRAGERVKDTMEVAVQTARDKVSGERVMASMEQDFVERVKKTDWGRGLPIKSVRNVFKIAREYSAEQGYTIAGLKPANFFKATEQELRGLLDASVVKKDMFDALVGAAGGDLRLLGLTPYVTQRLRSALSARGLNPDNNLGTVTVEMYGKFRYLLSPVFFVQAVLDAPWFNMYRGIGPVLRGGRQLGKAGSELAEMKVINDTLGRTGLYRDLAADITDRAFTIGWQESVRTGLAKLPGVSEGLATRIKNWSGQMILANELKFIHSEIGNSVYNALDEAQEFVDGNIANAATVGERQAWMEARADSRLMIENYKAGLEATLGRKLSKEEVGRRYLSEMIADSRLEQRTVQGLLDFKQVHQKGIYHSSNDIGKLPAMDLDYGALSLGLPNVKTAADLRKALNSGDAFIGDITDMMTEMNFHPDAIRRFRNAIEFNWRTYFDGLSSELGMTRHEMSAMEDLVRREATALGMDPVDYFSTVKTLTAGGKKGTTASVNAHMKALLDAVRVVEQGGEVGIEKIVKLVTDNLQPSMKARLLEHFEGGILGKEGLIEKAAAAGDAVAMKDLNKVVEDLRGGWGPAADRSFKDLLLARLGGEVIENPEVERALRYFSKYVQELNPKLLFGERLKEIVDSIPVAGASEYDMTQAVLMNTLVNNFRLLEKDAIRLAHMPTERSVLDRSINHPFFGMYPSSYWWGKVVPETFKFIAMEPFGLKTGVGALGAYRVQQTVALQQQYDERMAALWDGLGKSAVISALSYLSPGMPWEDIRASLPPWARVLSKSGLDIQQMYERTFDTMSPDRWVRDFIEPLEEVGEVIGDAFTQQAPTGPGVLDQPLTQGLEGISQEQPSGPASEPAPTANEPVKGVNLGPTLADAMAELEAALR